MGGVRWFVQTRECKERRVGHTHMHACNAWYGRLNFFCQRGASDQVGLTRGSVGGDVIQK